MADIHTTEAIHVEGDLHARDINVKIENIIKTPDPLAKNVRFKVEKPIQTFIGRETFLEELHKVVKEGQVTVLTQEPLSVVAATGGIGKTETVRRYIQLHEHEYDHIIWIDAEENSFAQRQFLQLATELKISTDFEGKQKEFESILKEIFGKLLLNAHVVLLVFDNAEAMDDDDELSLSGIRSLRPTSLSPFFVEPTIIVTSRYQNWSLQNVIHLDLWSDAEVVLFVTGQLKLERNSENETLALQLGTLFARLPIALQSAVAVILQQTRRKKNYGIGTLIDEYDNGCRKVMVQKPLDANMRPKQTSIPMLVLWNISLEKIVRYEDGVLAIEILFFMSFMSPVRIPQDFLYSLVQNDGSQDSFENAIVILEDYSLISSLSSDHSDSRSLSIHRMIQDSTIEYLKTRTTNKGHTPNATFSGNTFLNEVLLKLSAGSLNYLNTFFTTLTFPRREELVETLVQITNHVSGKLDVQEFRDLTAGVAKALQDTINFTKSIELFERALQATPAPSNDIEILKKIELQVMHANAYSQKGHVQKSLDLRLQVLEATIDFLGPHHEATLNTKCLVVNNLYNLERYDEAIKVCQEVLKVYENNGDTQSKRYLLAKSLYADLLFAKGEKKVALELLTQVLNEQKNDTDSNSHNIIVTNGKIALQRGKDGHLEEESKMRLQNIEDATKLLGPFHLTTLRCKQSYAIALHSQGKYDEAATLLLELLKTCETQLGPDHRNTLSTKLLLGGVYLATKELDQAEALLDVDVMEKVLGREHRDTLKAAILLALVKKAQRKFEDALALLQKVLEVHKNVLGPNHEGTLNTMHTIGNLYYKMKEYKKASSLLRKLLKTEETQVGPDHRSTLETKLTLALVYLETKELGKAEVLLDVQLWERVFGQEDPGTLQAATLLSDLKEEQEKFGEALALQKKVLKVRKKVLGPNHEDTLSTMYKMINLNVKMEEYEKAVEVAQELLERQEEAIGKDHPDAIFTLKLLTSYRKIIDHLNKFTMAFMTLTSVDAETSKSFLKASNWSLKAAIDAYRNSNPNARVADQDHASTSLGTLTAAENQNNLIVEFMAVTEVNAETGRSLLQASDWNLEVTLVSFFDSSFHEDDSDIELQENALILSAAATNAENQNAGTASCNETEVNQIRDIVVQVESVSESNLPTKSILFCLAGETRFRGQFGVSSTVKDLYNFVNEKRPELADCNYFLTLYPNIQLNKMEQTLEEAKIPKNVALTIKLLKE